MSGKRGMTWWLFYRPGLTSIDVVLQSSAESQILRICGKCATSSSQNRSKTLLIWQRQLGGFQSLIKQLLEMSRDRKIILESIDGSITEMSDWLGKGTLTDVSSGSEQVSGGLGGWWTSTPQQDELSGRLGGGWTATPQQTGFSGGLVEWTTGDEGGVKKSGEDGGVKKRGDVIADAVLLSRSVKLDN